MSKSLLYGILIGTSAIGIAKNIRSGSKMKWFIESVEDMNYVLKNNLESSVEGIWIKDYNQMQETLSSINLFPNIKKIDFESDQTDIDSDALSKGIVIPDTLPDSLFRVRFDNVRINNPSPLFNGPKRLITRGCIFPEAEMRMIETSSPLDLNIEKVPKGYTLYIPKSVIESVKRMFLTETVVEFGNANEANVLQRLRLRNCLVKNFPIFILNAPELSLVLSDHLTRYLEPPPFRFIPFVLKNTLIGAVEPRNVVELYGRLRSSVVKHQDIRQR